MTDDHNSLDTLTEHATTLEQHGWDGALLGTGWGRPDTFTVATALAARTTTFKPLIAIRPGYWRPANFASAAATLDHLSGGRVLVNIVSGQDDLAAYGDSEGDQAHRYARTKEFMQLVRRLWTEEDVTYTRRALPGHPTPPWRTRPVVRGDRTHPRLYFGGASEAAERVAATEADVQLFWGEPLDGVASGSSGSRGSSQELGREHAPLEFGLRITTLRARHHRAGLGRRRGEGRRDGRTARTRLQRSNPGFKAVGQQRLLDLAARGEVLDDNLYTAPGQVRRRRRRHHLAGRLGRGRRQVAAQVPGPRHHPLRALRHAVPAGDQAPGRPAAPAAAVLSA